MGKVQSRAPSLRLNDSEYRPWQSDMDEVCLEKVTSCPVAVIESIEIKQLLQ